MPPLETMDRRQKGLLWAKVQGPAGNDADGEQIVDGPQEILVRWTWGESEGRRPDGTSISLQATIATDRELSMGSILWEGRLADYNGTDEKEYMEVATESKATDLKNRFTRRTYGLVRFRGSLPTLL